MRRCLCTHEGIRGLAKAYRSEVQESIKGDAPLTLTARIIVLIPSHSSFNYYQNYERAKFAIQSFSVMAEAEAFKELPRDIAAVDVKGKTYVFFVNSNHQLCYLVSPGAGTDDYDPKLVELTDGDLKVKCGSRQIAAAAWQGGNGQEVSLITSFHEAL